MSGFTRTITETFGGGASTSDASNDVPDVPKPQVIVGVQLSRSTWDKAIGALSLAVAVGSMIYLKNSFQRWRTRVNQEYQTKEEARLRRKRNAVAADVFHAARYPEDARVELDLHQAACHCSRVKVTVRAPIHLRAVDCSTAMSTKKGRFPYIFVDADDFRLDCGGDFLTVYTHGTHTAKHMFCSACGVHVFAFPRGSPEAGGISVNVHTLGRENVASLHVSFVPGDHLMHDFEPTVPTVPTSPSSRRLRLETMGKGGGGRGVLETASEGQQQDKTARMESPSASSSVSSNPQTSSPVSSPLLTYQQPLFQQSQNLHPYLAQPTLAELLAPGLPRPVEDRNVVYGVEGGQLPMATQVPNAGQGLAGVNFFRKTRHVQNTPPRSLREPTIMQTLVHGGGAAAYAIGRAAGVLSPENQSMDAMMSRQQENNHRNTTTPYRSNATTFSSSGPLSSASSTEQRRMYRTRQISPIRAIIDGHDPLYNTRVRNTEVKKMESMNSVISIKHQLQRYLGQHKTPQRGERHQESGYYNGVSF